MIEHYLCPLCGNTTSVPIIFSGARQKIFAYIWDNPLCSIRDIECSVYNGHAPSRHTVYMHVNKIREALADLGQFTLAGNPEFGFRIIHATKLRIPQNGTV